MQTQLLPSLRLLFLTKLRKDTKSQKWYVHFLRSYDCRLCNAVRGFLHRSAAGQDCKSTNCPELSHCIGLGIKTPRRTFLETVPLDAFTAFKNNYKPCHGTVLSDSCQILDFIILKQIFVNDSYLPLLVFWFISGSIYPNIIFLLKF